MSNNNVKMEFAAKFSCQNCEKVFENIFKNEKNVNSYSIDKNKGTVIVESSLSTTQVKELLMNACQDVVLRGVSTGASGMKGRGFGSGVSIIQGSNNDIVGVVRLFQVSDGECIAEGTVDGLPANTSHALSVHELGDLSDGCSSCGKIYQDEEDEKKNVESKVSSEPPCKRSKVNSSRSIVKWVCPPEFTCIAPHLLPVYVIDFHQPKLLSPVLTLLCSQYPLDGFTHLKRVSRKDEVYQILLSDSLERCCTIMSVLTNKFDLTIESSRISWVPAVPPSTRLQFELYSKYWPCTFHPNNSIEKLLSENCFNDEELRQHEYWMLKAFEMINSSDKDYHPIGVVIVDSKNNSLVASASDLRNIENVSDHAIMVAIDLVAEGCGAGAHSWSLKYPNFIRADKNSFQSSDYLCTGYDVYVSSEPCLMCAMALVHSRANRLFYSVPSRFGGLASFWNLQNLSTLNHKLTVFKGLLCEQFHDLFGKDFLCFC